jgi:hypothetical protein
MDTTKYPEERARLSPLFPRLGHDFEVVKPSDESYRAFHHVFGDYQKFVSLQTGPADAPLSHIDGMFREAGYSRLPGFDTRVEAGKQKAVLYCTLNPDGTIKEIKSAALQEADGTYTMKVGTLGLIRFKSLEQFRGLTYGVATAVYVRERPAAAPEFVTPPPAFDPTILDIRR